MMHIIDTYLQRLIGLQSDSANIVADECLTELPLYSTVDKFKLRAMIFGILRRYFFEHLLGVKNPLALECNQNGKPGSKTRSPTCSMTR